jgi:hypothetical protein
VGVDIWHHTAADGRGITKALDYLISYADPENEKPWPFKQITEKDPAQIVPLLYQAACRFPDRNYDELAQKLEKGKINLNRINYPCRN